MDEFGCYGPNLQTAMFIAQQAPDPDRVEAISEGARRAFAMRP
jgi:hypothetical protein